jgi:hypothetical protein
MIRTLGMAALLLAAAPAGSAPPTAGPLSAAGTWDLIWQTRRGPERQGWLVLRQQGARLEGDIHGRGSIRAKGSIAGGDFVLRGSRLAVPYTISGRIEGDRMAGHLKVLSVDRPFRGERRR